MTSSPTEDPAAGFAVRLAAIEEAIAAACAASGRPRAAVRLLAVSKEQPDAAVRALHALGQRDFGENRIQALRQRVEAFAAEPPLSWHLIGPVQTNKAKDIAQLRPALVHTVDRPALVDALAARWQHDTPLDVCVQVNMDAEPQKAGCEPAALGALVDHISATPALRLRGLMAIPAPAGDASLRRAFAGLRVLGERIADRIAGPVELSMGMSDDFPLAIAEGATIIRVGTGLFGPRHGRG
jgi:pyridoxal phosphate enzyme (YggS family)